MTLAEEPVKNKKTEANSTKVNRKLIKNIFRRQSKKPTEETVRRTKLKEKFYKNDLKR